MIFFSLGLQGTYRDLMVMKPMACNTHWSYHSNEISCSKKEQGMAMIHLSQVMDINVINGTLPKTNLAL